MVRKETSRLWKKMAWREKALLLKELANAKVGDGEPD